MAKNKINVTNDFEIVVDDGKKRVPIKNQFGEELGVFYFRPTDLGIIDRYEKAAAKFAAVASELEQTAIAPDGSASADDPEIFASLDRAREKLFGLVDEIFDGNAAEAFFGKVNPFSPINGHFYCEIMIENLGKFINAQFADEIDKTSKRLSKYTAKYQA